MPIYIIAIANFSVRDGRSRVMSIIIESMTSLLLGIKDHMHAVPIVPVHNNIIIMFIS